MRTVSRRRSPRDVANKGLPIAVFSSWMPGMYRYYQRYMAAVEGETGLQRDFRGSAFACATVNFGPRVRTVKHRDMMNLAFGMCAITALGTFNHEKGGHLVLWDAKVIVELAAGSTAIIPSATLSHSNTDIGEDETRASFTQYSSGGLFRWVDNGFKTDVELKKDPKAYQAILEKRKGRWLEGLALLSTVQGLCQSL